MFLDESGRDVHPTDHLVREVVDSFLTLEFCIEFELGNPIRLLSLTPLGTEVLAAWPGRGGGSFHPRSVPNISGGLFSIFNLF